LPGCHSFSDTLDEARADITEAIELYIESMQADGESVSIELL
jgi:predicted RNase H-like HicB family nuclease